MITLVEINYPFEKKGLVLDSTAFYAGIPFTGPTFYFTTPLVLQEITCNKALSIVMKGLSESGRLSTIEPKDIYVIRVRELANKSGDISKISDTDISVIALSIQLKTTGYDVTVLSDDYSVQNLVGLLGLKYSPVMTRGISKTVRWIIYCAGCGKTFDNRNTKVCDVCGTILKRRMRSGIYYVNQ